jgi:hypothetical protein
LSEWLLKSLGNAAASAALVGATKDTVFGRPRLSDVAAKLSRRNPPGRSGIVFGLGQARGTAAFPGPASVPKDSLLGDAAPSALRKTFFSSRALGPRDLDLRSGLQKTRRRHAGSSSREAGQECGPRREAWVEKPRNQPAPKGRKIKTPGHAASAPAKSGFPRLDRGRKQHLTQLHLRKPA